MAQYIADDQLSAVGPGGRDDALGVGDGGCQRFLDEDMAAGLERQHSIIGMAVGIGVDRGDIGPELGNGFLEGGAHRVAGEFGRRLAGAVDQRGDLEARIVVIGERVALAHIAEPGNDDPQRRPGVHWSPRMQPCRRPTSFFAVAASADSMSE